MNKYGLKITYSWGDEEPLIMYKTKDAAWKEAKMLAMNEAEIVSEENECEIGLAFNEKDGIIQLHYTYDDEYCYYKILKL